MTFYRPIEIVWNIWSDKYTRPFFLSFFSFLFAFCLFFLTELVIIILVLGSLKHANACNKKKIYIYIYIYIYIFKKVGLLKII